MNKYTLAFELGIHYGLLSAEWDQLKDCPTTFNVLERQYIATKMNSLDKCIAKTNFKSLYRLKELKKEIRSIDNYISEEQKKSRVLKDLSAIPNLTSTSKSTSQ